MLRRYLNDLPEPVVPLDLYEQFRDPLRGATKQAVGDAEGPQFVEDFDEKAAIDKYQKLITELPPLNRQLLLYILDLLAVFAAKSDENRMNSQNLAAIFQPGMLSHPNHAMAPEEYRLNQCVIIFLIENQDHFLIGMQGTAADEKTVKEVQSGTPKLPLTPIQSGKTGLDRSASNASAAAESVRKDGQLRRNRSVSSKHSKQDGTSTPNSPATATTPTTTGLGRSNTLPSKKSPALVGGKFKRQDGNAQPASGAVEPMTPARIAEETQAPALETSQSPSEVPSAPVNAEPEPPAKTLENAPDAPSAPKEKERGLQGLFSRTPTEGSDKRQPNKLRKKRIPGTMNISAHSSNVSLSHPHSNTASPSYEASNPMESVPPISETMEKAAKNPSTAPVDATKEAEQTAAAAPAVSTAAVVPQDDGPTEVTHSPTEQVNSGPESGAGPNDAVVASTEASTDKEKKKRWRLSRAKKDDSSTSPSGLIPPQIGSNENADVSTTSFASSTNKGRKSLQVESNDALASDELSEGSRSKEDSKGPIGWIKSKYREAKENVEQKRAKSPSDEQVEADPGTSAATEEKTPDAQNDTPAEQVATVSDKTATEQSATSPALAQATEPETSAPQAATKENPQPANEATAAPATEQQTPQAPETSAPSEATAAPAVTAPTESVDTAQVGTVEQAPVAADTTQKQENQ